MSQPDLANPAQPYPGGPQMPAPGQSAPMMAGGAPQAPRPAVQKQRFNVYTMLLVMSFVAMVIGCVALSMELSDYGEGNAWPPWNIPSAAKPDPAKVTTSVDLPVSQP